MKLIDDWQRVLFSYSLGAFVILIAIALAPDVIYIATGVDTNPVIWTVGLLVFAVLGAVGRFVKQTKEGRWFRRLVIFFGLLGLLLGAAPAMAQPSERETMRVLMPLVIQWEGSHRCPDDASMHCAYLDIVGVPTLCYGETKGVKIGQRATDVQCLKMLEVRLTDDFRDGLHGFFTDTTKRTRMTPERDAAYVSLAYNVGIHGAGRSTATRRLNAGDIAGGCKALKWWNKAGGRVVRGLVNRRAHEYRLCIKGLT